MDILRIKNAAKKGARVILRSWSIAWRTTNEEGLSRPWWLKNVVEIVREKAAQEDVLVLHLIRNAIGDLEPVTKPAYCA